MKLRKFTAVSLTVVMAVSALTGCGSKEQEKDNTKTADNKQVVSAESFSDALKKGSEISNYDYIADIAFSVKADELFAYGGEEAEEILDALGLSLDTLDFKFTVDGSVKGTDAQSMTLGFEVGGISGDLTEIVYVDDTLYVNVAKTVDMIEQVADKFGVKDLVSTYLALLPEGDYISVSKDTLTEIGEAVLKAAQVTEADFADTLPDTEEVEKAVYYLMDEIEKAAQKAEDVYSSQNGYSITVNNNNILSFMGAVINVLVEDRDEIIKNIKIVAGDVDISIEDAFDKIKISTEEDREKFLEDMKSAKEEMPDFDFEISTNYSGNEGSAVWSFGCNMKAKDSEADMSMSVNVKVKENDSVKIKAPESVMAKEDIDALLSLMGIESIEDITSAFGSMDYNSNDFDYDYNDVIDFDYDMDDLAA